MLKKTLAIASATLLIVLVAFAATRTEIPNKSPEMLEKGATHIAVGEVVRIYKVEEKESKWKYTRCVAELRVEVIEKGEGFAAGELLYVRWFSRRYRGGTPPPSSNGYHGKVPSSGDRVRVYLARNAHDGFNPDNLDGGYNVLIPNGFEKLAATEK